MKVEQRERERPERRAAIYRFVPLLLWIGVIFFLSSSQGSMPETSRFVRPILKFFFPDAAEFTLQLYHGYIRKFAHFFEYAVLALIAAGTFLRAGSQVLQSYRLPAAIGMVAAVAAIDEFHQWFEPSRTGAFGDVMIDVAGGVAMAAVLWLWSMWRRRRSPKG